MIHMTEVRKCSVMWLVCFLFCGFYESRKCMHFLVKKYSICEKLRYISPVEPCILNTQRIKITYDHNVINLILDLPLTSLVSRPLPCFQCCMQKKYGSGLGTRLSPTSILLGWSIRWVRYTSQVHKNSCSCSCLYLPTWSSLSTPPPILSLYSYSMYMYTLRQGFIYWPERQGWSFQFSKCMCVPNRIRI